MPELFLQITQHEKNDIPSQKKYQSLVKATNGHGKHMLNFYMAINIEMKV